MVCQIKSVSHEKKWLVQLTTQTIPSALHETTIKPQYAAKGLDIGIFHFITENIKKMHTQVSKFSRMRINNLTDSSSLCLRETGFSCTCLAVMSITQSVYLGVAALTTA